ncbi:transporter [Streptomyces sp. NBC_00102]|uniref:transporter n=1 Tax=Streptomyces sp. NBC_00102 TaxID=2975652 RepID=UPI002254099F|nr:transporter [Streptomyces sp. NBC_00102]MCX5397679.1 transporter [Streptomyces sp. NBC_00102]
MSVLEGRPAPVTSVPDSGTEGLVPLFVRLKLALLRNGLRQSAGRRAAFVVTLVVVVLIAAGQLLGLVLLRGEGRDAATVTVLATGVLALGWAVLPLFFPSGDETLDPSRLVMLPLRPRPLVRALLAASLVGVGPLFALCLLVGSVVALAHGALAVVFGVVAVPLALLICVALARSVATANIRLLTSRRGRDLAVLSGLVIAVGIQFVNFGAQRIGEAGGLSSLEPAAGVVRWLPAASAIGAVDSASTGAYGEAVAQLLVSVVALAALLWWWQRGLVTLMTAPDGSTIAAAGPSREKARDGRSPRLGRLLPEGRTRTVMGRSLRYVLRDPKTKGAWITSLAVGLIVPVFNALQGTGSVYFACFAPGLLGMQMYNQFGQDTSAFWMVAQTISTPRDAYEELRARALALAVVTVPYTLAVGAVTAGLLGSWGSLTGVVGVSCALLGAMSGLGALGSALFPYSIPQDGGFKNVAPGQGGLAWLSVVTGMLGSAVVAAPVIVLTVALTVTDHGSLWLVVPVGAVYGVAVAWAGLRLAGKRTADRLPEILAAVSKG